EEGDNLSYVSFPKNVWPQLLEIVKQEKNPHLQIGGKSIELENFYEELLALIYNIEGNDNYGEDFVKAVEVTFHEILAEETEEEFTMGQWDVFLSPYKQAVDELKIKLKGMRSQFGIRGNTSPIEFVTGRVKPLASIYDKSLEKGIPFEPSERLAEEMQDIAGLRIMCQFVDDITTVTNLIRQRDDLRV
ncbi:hypothetical protein RhiirA1_485132, partial [Rhizophagus irregularis]